MLAWPSSLSLPRRFPAIKAFAIQHPAPLFPDYSTIRYAAHHPNTTPTQFLIVFIIFDVIPQCTIWASSSAKLSETIRHRISDVYNRAGSLCLSGLRTFHPAIVLTSFRQLT